MSSFCFPFILPLFLFFLGLFCYFLCLSLCPFLLSYLLRFPRIVFPFRTPVSPNLIQVLTVKAELDPEAVQPCPGDKSRPGDFKNECEKRAGEGAESQDERGENYGDRDRNY